VCLLTFGGGLVDGDAIDVDLRVEAGATLVFTQATAKAFRGSSRQTIRAEVHGTLVFLPDPVACFAGSRYRQRVDITLHGEGSAVTLDGFTSGRAAFGDRWASRSAGSSATRCGSAWSPTTSSRARTPSSFTATRRSPRSRSAPSRPAAVRAAIREGISPNLDALEQLMRLGPPPELLLVESGGDNLAAQYSRELVDFTIYVVDLAGGARSPARVDPA
jgi:hypothetical protein